MSVHESLIFTIKAQMDGALKQFKQMDDTVKQTQSSLKKFNEQRAKQDKAMVHSIKTSNYGKLFKPILDAEKAVQDAAIQTQKTIEATAKANAKAEKQSLKERQDALKKYNKELDKFNEQRGKQDQARLRSNKQSMYDNLFGAITPAQQKAIERANASLREYNQARAVQDQARLRSNKQSMYDNLFGAITPAQQKAEERANQARIQAMEQTKKSWRDQIKIMNLGKTVSSNVMQHKVAVERAKQREIHKTTQAELKRQREIHKTTQAGLKRQQSAMGKIGNYIMPGIGAGFGMAAANLAIKSVKALKDAIGTGIEFNMMEESAKTMYSVILKDGDKAVKLMEDLKAASLGSVLVYKDALISARQLLAYGFQDSQVVSTMQMLGDVSAATGKNIQDLAYVYGTLRTQGKAYARDLTQFAMRGIPIYEELAKILGTTSTAMLQDVKRGRVDIMFGDVEKAFKNMVGSGGVFEGAGTARIKTIEGQLTLLGEKFDIAMGNFTKALDPGIRMLINFADAGIDAINGIAAAVEAIDQMIRDAKGITDGEVALERAKTAIRGGADAGDTVSQLLRDNDFYIKVLSESLKDIRKGMPESRTNKEFMLNLGKAWVTASDDLAKQLGVPLEVVVKELQRGRLSGGLQGALAAWVSVAMEDRKQTEDYNKNTAELTQAIQNLELLEYSTTGPMAQLLQGVFSGKQVGTVNPLTEAATEISAAVAYFVNRISPIGRPNTPDTTGRFESQVIGVDATLDRQVTRGGFEEFHSTIQLMWDEVQKQTYKQFTDLADRIGSSTIAEEATSEYTKAIKTAIQAVSTALVETVGDMGGKRGEIENFLKYLTDELKTVGAGGKLKADPEIWQDIFPTTTLSKINDLNREQEKRIKAINEAYKDSEGTQADWDKSIKHTDQMYDSLIESMRRFEADMDGMDAGILRAQMAAMGGGTQSQIDLQELEFRKQQITAQHEFDKTLSALTNDETKEADIAKLTELHNLQMEFANKEHVKRLELMDLEQALGRSTEFTDGLKDQAAAAFQSGDSAAAGGLYGAAAGMEGSQAAGLAGDGDPMAMFVEALVKAIMSVENISKTLNFMDTILAETMEVVDYLFNHAFQPIVNILEILGKVIGQILSPFIVIADIIVTLIYQGLQPLLAVLQIVGGAFEMLSDFVIIPFANTVIDASNAIADVLNTVFGFLGVNLPKLERILTRAEREQQDAKMAETVDVLGAAIGYLKDKLRKEVDAIIGSLRDMYEVGAISATEYEAESKKQMEILNQFDDTYKLLLEKLPAVLEASSPESIAAMLNEIIPKYEDAKENGTIVALDKLNATLERIELLSGKGSADAGTLSDIASTPASPIGVTGQSGGAAEPYRLAAIESMTAGTDSLMKWVRDISSNWLLTPDAKATIGQQVSDLGISADFAEMHRLLGQGDTNAAFTAYNRIKSKIPELNAWIDQWYGMLGISGLPSFAVGTNNVPHDMIAQIHKGEMIVPKPYADDMRKGGDGDVNVTVVVQGSVQSENDLAKSIANAMYKQRRTGALTV